MWSAMYVALFALAAGATYVFVVQEEAVVFTSAIASAAWGLLAMYATTIDVVTDSGVETVGIGAGQYFIGGLALLSMFAFAGSLIGWYPENEQIHDAEYSKP